METKTIKECMYNHKIWLYIYIYKMRKKKVLTSDIILEFRQLIRLLEEGGSAASDRRQEVVVAEYQSRCPMGHHRPVVIGDYGAPPEGLLLPPRAGQLGRNETRVVPTERRWTVAHVGEISSGSRRISHVSSPANRPRHPPRAIRLVP